MSPLVSEVIAIARRIGRWIVEHLVKHGATRLGHYMILRADTVFRRRLARAKTPRRKAWLKGRIKRWTAVGEWLLARAEEIGTCVAAEGDVMLARAKGLPHTARCERRVGA